MRQITNKTMTQSFKTRYVERNHYNNDGYLFRKEFREDIKSAHPYIAPFIICFSPLLKKLYINRHSKQIKDKIKKRPYKALWLVPFYLLAKITKILGVKWDNLGVRIRLWCGKVDIPYFEVVLTTRCTMRCEHCGNLMQYFSPKNQYTCSADEILETLNTIFEVVDSVGYVQILGGEPLLFKDIVKVVERLDTEPKLRKFGIITNGTIKPKQDLLVALSKSKKFCFDISDYSSSPNLKVKLYYKEIISLLEEYHIPYEMKFENEPLKSWWDFGKIYKRNRDKDGNIENFRACSRFMVCYSVMSNEGLDKIMGGGALQSHSNSQSKGQIFICPVASSLSRLRGLDEFEGDFVQLDSSLTKEKILAFYNQEFFKACDYCHDYAKVKTYVPVGVQTDEVLQIQDYSEKDKSKKE